jgi:hypothetical protein
VVASAVLAACGSQGGAIPSQSGSGFAPEQAMRVASGTQTIADLHHWTARTIVLPARNVDYQSLGKQAAASQTIPFYTSSVKSPLTGSTYNYQIVGADPTKSNKTTKVLYVPIAVRVHFPDGTVLDPSKPGCGDNVAVDKRFFDGPNFIATPLKSNGINVGKTQVTDAFQRAEFWNVLKGPKYHTVLKSNAALRLVDVNAPSGSTTDTGVCPDKKKVSHRLGEIDLNAYDNIVVGLANQYATPNEVPVILTYNIVLTSGGCCIIGYHSAYGRASGTQTYSVGAYNDPGIFSVPIEDIHVWTHELGELINDPFVGNATPAWGHIGQVGGCQGNLEVGDPLTGTPYILKYNGFTYHPQELAFFDWFFRTPSNGTGGKYSFEGTFTTAQGACH